MDRLESFRNLLVMAAADGKMTEEEVTYLSLRSVRWGITNEQFRAALEYATDPNSKMSLPATKAEALEMLGDLIRMMAIDGELADVEKQLFAIAAAKMDISATELDQLLTSLL
jgi:uncharacterized tellurite resistance protein B-like protein